MNFKKILTGSLAGAMALSMAVPAFAASANSSNLSIAAKAQVPTINVAVPTTTNVVLNPYKLSVVLTKGEEGVTDQIATKVMYLKNLSNCDIQVGLKVSGTVAGNAKLVESTTTGAANDGTEANNVFMYFEGQIVDNEEETLSWAATVDPEANGGQVIVGKTATAPTTFDPASNTLTVGTNVLAAATLVGKTPADADGMLAFKLDGDAITKPKTAWSAADTVTTTLAFTFTPAVDADPAAAGG